MPQVEIVGTCIISVSFGYVYNYPKLCSSITKPKLFLKNSDKVCHIYIYVFFKNPIITYHQN